MDDPFDLKSGVATGGDIRSDQMGGDVGAAAAGYEVVEAGEEQSLGEWLSNR